MSIIRRGLGNIFMLCLMLLSFSLSYNSWAQSELIRYGELGQPTTLDPITSSDMVSRRLCELIYSGLLDFDEQHKPVWRIATGEPEVRNLVEYTFSLRGAKWHDGKSFTPEDIVLTVEALKAAPDKKEMVDFIHEVRSEGNTKVTFILRDPILNVLGRVAFKIIPKHIVKETPVNVDNPIARNPVGLGPYRFSRRGSDGAIYLEKNIEYFGDPPKIDQIAMLSFVSDDQIFNSLLYGGIQIAISLRNIDANIINTGSKQPVELLTVIPYSSLSYQCFALNLSQERKTVGARFLQGDGDKEAGIRVRQALNYGTNRQDWVDRLLYGGAELISGPFAPGSPYVNENVPVYPYDVKKANDLLDEAGFSRDSAGFRRTGDGKTIVLKALKIVNAKVEEEIWEALETDLRNLGIKLEFEVLDIERWKKKVYYEHDFDIVLDTWSFSSAGEIYSLFHTSENDPGENNYISYSNEYVDLLLDRSRRVLDAAQFQDINKYIHEILNIECPYIFLWSPYKYAGRVTRLGGFRIHPFAFFTYVTDWYIRSE